MQDKTIIFLEQLPLRKYLMSFFLDPSLFFRLFAAVLLLFKGFKPHIEARPLPVNY